MYICNPCITIHWKLWFCEPAQLIQRWYWRLLEGAPTWWCTVRWAGISPSSRRGGGACLSVKHVWSTSTWRWGGGGLEGPPQRRGTACCWSTARCTSLGSSILWIGRFWDLHKVALLNFLWFGDITYNMQCGFSVLPSFAVTRCRAYHPPGVEESRTLLSDWMVGFRLFFSGGLRFRRIFSTCTAPVCAVHCCSNHVCITCVHHLCAVQWYGTVVCSAVFQHLCV